MPTDKVVVDVSTGEVSVEELTQAEIDANAALVAAVAEREANPPPSKNDILLTMLDTIDPAEPDTTVLWLVLQEALRP